MRADLRNTMNPVLHFDVVTGGYNVEELMRRTLSLTLTDNWHGYDELEWSLDNSDGMLTDIKNLALGLVVRIRLGYTSDTQNWRTFVISRMTGGVGVKQMNPNIRAAVGENESVIEFSGRTRNAPDLKGRRGKGKKNKGQARVTGGGRGTQRSKFKGSGTSDITKLDHAQRSAWHGAVEGDRRIFKVRRVSDAIREIGYRHGYTDQNMYIEESSDIVESIVIPSGFSDFDYCRLYAQAIGWIFKESAEDFSFHSQRWSRSNRQQTKHAFTYGGSDIIDLNLDFDFRLPVPNKVTVKGYNAVTRGAIVQQIDENGVNIMAKVGRVCFKRGAPAVEQRRQHLQKDIVHLVPGGSSKQATLKAQAKFIDRHVRAMKIGMSLVGNPDVQGGNDITLDGTNSELVDGLWFAQVVKHIFSGETYTTEVDMRPPRKQAGKGKVKFKPAHIVEKQKQIGAKGRIGRFHTKSLSETTRTQAYEAIPTPSATPSATSSKKPLYNNKGDEI